MTPIEKALDQIWETLYDHGNGKYKGDASKAQREQAFANLAALRAQPAAQPPYPEGDVAGPCVCGSWPGGKCLQCKWVPAQPDHSELVRDARRWKHIAETEWWLDGFNEKQEWIVGIDEAIAAADALEGKV